jgi:SAM-dependent methyltransferase
MSADFNATRRFSDRVADYVKARPGYPDELVDLLEREIALATTMQLADVGSGTGLSAEPFLRRGYGVACVEPNAAMRGAAETMLGDYSGFRSIDGTAEATGLPDDSIDCIIVAQAFHWFDVQRTRDEFIRILRTGGWTVLLWNTRLTEGTPFLGAYEALLQQFGTDYAQVQHRTGQLASGEQTAGSALDDFYRGSYERHVLRNAQSLDRDGLRSRVRSASYMPAEGSAGHVPMMAALGDMFDQHADDGRVTLEYHLEVYFGRLR